MNTVQLNLTVHSTKTTMKKLIIAPVVIFILMIATATFSQTENGMIRGKVIDKETKSPLQDAVVELLETKQKTGTNEKGEFIIEGLKESSYRIKVTYIGYENVKVKVTNDWIKQNPTKIYLSEKK